MITFIDMWRLDTCARHTSRGQGTTCLSWFCTSTMLVSGIKLRPSDLVAGISSQWAILPGQEHMFNWMVTPQRKRRARKWRVRKSVVRWPFVPLATVRCRSRMTDVAWTWLNRKQCPPGRLTAAGTPSSRGTGDWPFWGRLGSQGLWQGRCNGKKTREQCGCAHWLHHGC